MEVLNTKCSFSSMNMATFISLCFMWIKWVRHNHNNDDTMELNIYIYMPWGIYEIKKIINKMPTPTNKKVLVLLLLHFLKLPLLHLLKFYNIMVTESNFRFCQGFTAFYQRNWVPTQNMFRFCSPFRARLRKLPFRARKSEQKRNIFWVVRQFLWTKKPVLR